MRFNSHPQKLFLIYLSIACIGMIILAASIGNMEFKPGLPIPGASTNNLSSSSQSTDTSTTVEKNPTNPVLLEVGLGFFVLVLIVLIIYSLARRTERKKLLVMIIGLIACLFIFKILEQMKPSNINFNENQRIEVSINSTSDPEIVPIEEPPSQLFWVVFLCLIILTLGILFFVFTKVGNKMDQDNMYGKEADLALEAIQEGKDLRNIIINCYEQFNRIIKQEYEIERERSLTVREFENYLINKGIPLTPIHQITTLFERVRYGNKPTDLDDERIAIESLSAIRLSCQKNR